jgi:hypothetical protein
MRWSPSGVVRRRSLDVIRWGVDNRSAMPADCVATGADFPASDHSGGNSLSYQRTTVPDHFTA